MDNVIWLTRRPGFTGDPLTVVRRAMCRARECLGASEEEFGRLLQAALPHRKITAAMVRAWEHGPTPPPGDVLAVAMGLMGRALVIELEEGADDGAPAVRELGGFDEDSRLAAQPAVSVDAARLRASATGICGVDRRVVEDFAILTEEYWCLYHRMAPKSLQPVVSAHHDLMQRLLANSAATQRGQLAAALGQAAMLDGWLSFLLDDRRTARARWAFAEELAREFGDGPLRAHVLIARSSLASTTPTTSSRVRLDASHQQPGRTCTNRVRPVRTAVAGSAQRPPRGGSTVEQPLRQFTLANSEHPNHTVRTREPHRYLRWRNTNARHPDVLAAQRRERARIRSEKGIRWGGRQLRAA